MTSSWNLPPFTLRLRPFCPRQSRSSVVSPLLAGSFRRALAVLLVRGKGAPRLGMMRARSGATARPGRADASSPGIKLTVCQASQFMSPHRRGMRRAVQRAHRACLRDLGPPWHTAASPVSNWPNSPQAAPLVRGGPACLAGYSSWAFGGSLEKLSSATRCWATHPWQTGLTR